MKYSLYLAVAHAMAIFSLLLPGTVVDTTIPTTASINVATLDGDECSHAPDLYFGEACAYHDKCYYNSWAERAKCDKWFLDDMLSACQELPLRPAAFCGTQAFMYYLVVRVYGGSYYSFSDRSPGRYQCVEWLTEKGKRQSLDFHVIKFT